MYSWIYGQVSLYLYDTEGKVKTGWFSGKFFNIRRLFYCFFKMASWTLYSRYNKLIKYGLDYDSRRKLNLLTFMNCVKATADNVDNPTRPQ